jgi:cytidylate kinase
VNSPLRVIAIDGPAASGKSSVARELARRLGFAYVNSGAMYRAATWYALEHHVDLKNAQALADLIQSAPIVCDLVENQSRLTIAGADPADFLREDRVNEGVSLVSSVPGVREILVKMMRDCAANHEVVMEGRDIGSVVFPDTPYKFYIDASPEIRLHRRLAQGERDQIAARDRADSSRRASPLMIAEDAHVIDSSHLTIDGVVGEIIGQLKRKGMKIS